MKKILLIVSILFTQFALAQFNDFVPWNNSYGNQKANNSLATLDNNFKAYFTTHNMFAKSSGMKPYMRWRYVWQDYFKSDGFKPISTIDRAYARKQQMAHSVQDNSNWTNIGPSMVRRGGSSGDKGRVNAVLVDYTNDQIMYVGTPAGGIWKTTNKGVDWTPLTDHLPQIGVSAIAMSPVDHNTIFIGTGDDDARKTYSRGVYKSIDGGSTWQAIGPQFSSETEVISEIIIHPNQPNIIFVASSDGLFKSVDGGLTWQRKQNGNIKEMRMHPANPDIIYTVLHQSFYKSVDGGETFTEQTLSNTAVFGRMVLDVTPAAPNKVYVATTAVDGNFTGLYVSDNSGDTFTRTQEFANIFGNRNQTWYDFAIAVSDVDPNIIFIGNIDIYKSTDGGDDFVQFNNWNTVNEQYSHADIHFLRFYNQKLLVGSDGGVYISNTDTNALRGMNRNLVIGQFYRISIANESDYQIYGGLQDNGGYSRRSMNWRIWHGGDGMDNVISNQNHLLGYSFLYYGQALFITTNGGLTIANTVSPPTGVLGNWVTPLAIDAYDRVYAGFDKLYVLNHDTWQPVNGTPFTSNIQTITIDPQNPDHILLGVAGALHETNDGGTTFTEIFTSPDRVQSIAVNSIENKIWVATSYSVWESSDAGNTWVDITSNLPGERKNVLRYQMFSPHNSLYLGTDLGVYYRDDTSGDWQVFSQNLPNTLVYDLEFNASQSLLVAATHGRGVWETPIPQYLPDYDAKLKEIVSDSGNMLECSAQPTIKFIIENNGTSAITQMDITYIIDGVSQTENWTGSLDSNQTVEITPPGQNWTPGLHSIEARVVLNGDQYIGNNMLTKNIIINKQAAIPYVNDFENTPDDELISYSNRNASSWELAVPSGTKLAGTVSGTKAYCTFATGVYNNNTLDYLLSPCYDLTQLNNPEISFYLAYDIERDYDAFYIEYSIDNGNTWQLLGASGDRNWYNGAAQSGVCVGGQWTGTNLSMKHYKHSLSFIGNEPNVVFRFVMASDPLEAGEGVVLDKFKIDEAGTGQENSKLNLYPNPANKEVHLQWYDIKPQNVTIANLQGMIIYEKAIASSMYSLNIDVSNLSKGVYLVTLHTNDETHVRKLIVK